MERSHLEAYNAVAALPFGAGSLYEIAAFWLAWNVIIEMRLGSRVSPGMELAAEDAWQLLRLGGGFYGRALEREIYTEGAAWSGG